MTDEDRPAFVSTFQRLALTFRLKVRPADMDHMIETYVRTFEPYPLHEVVAAGNACVQTHRRFPKPVDWLEVITRTQVGAPPDARVMSTHEAAEWVRAERLHWNDDDGPCGCMLCLAVGIVRPRRFVPDFTDDDRDERAFCPPKNRIVVVGHWAHGDELERWYAARDRFFASAPKTTPLARALRALVPREPGQEG